MKIEYLGEVLPEEYQNATYVGEISVKELLKILYPNLAENELKSLSKHEVKNNE